MCLCSIFSSRSTDYYDKNANFQQNTKQQKITLSSRAKKRTDSRPTRTRKNCTKACAEESANKNNLEESSQSRPFFLPNARFRGAVTSSLLCSRRCVFVSSPRCTASAGPRALAPRLMSTSQSPPRKRVRSHRTNSGANISTSGASNNTR